MIICQNEFCVSTFEKEGKIVKSTFRGRVRVDFAKEHLEELGEFYLHTKVKASIVDISKLYGSYAKILEYIKTEFLPKTKVSGIKLKAYVVSDDVIVAHLSSKLVDGDVHNKIYSKVFSDLCEAEEWIKYSLD